MSSPFSRPLFRGNFLQHYAEGGIVSTVAGPEDPMQGQAQDPMAILGGMAQQVDTTEKNLDAAGSLDEILSSFTGEPTTAADARMKLGALVGEKDAKKTPDSVLALVQPAMAIMEMSRQMQPQGGIQKAPFNGSEGMPMPPQGPEAGMPPANFQQGLPAYARGGEVNMDALMAKYAALEGQIPQGYAADPNSAWLALAQMGAGIASGPSFAQGLAKGTELAGPYMQTGIENVSKKKSALQAFVANEAQNQEQNNFTADQNAAQIAAQITIARENNTAQATEGALNRNMQWDVANVRTEATPAEAKLVDSYMATTGLEEGSAEYNQVRGELLKKAIEGKGGTTLINNLGDKADVVSLTNQYASEKKTTEQLDKDAESARKTKEAIAPTLALLEPVRQGKKPAFSTGAGGPTRLFLGQVANTFDSIYGTNLSPTVQKYVGGDPTAAEAMDASMAQLKTAAAESLSRATNLQITVLTDAFPSLSKTPEGNLILADLLNRSADRTLKVDAYNQKLLETYAGTNNPATKPKEAREKLYADAGVASFNGAEKNIPFDENGNPIMSLSQYKTYLDKTDPILNKEETARLQKLKNAPTPTWSDLQMGWLKGALPGESSATGNEDWLGIPAGKGFIDEGGRHWIRTANGRVPDPNFPQSDGGR